MPVTIALTDAKAELSAVVRDVGERGQRYILTVRGEPLAMIVPMPKPAPKVLKAAGMLAGMRPKVSHEEEKAAYAAILEGKYGNTAGH